MKAAHLRERRGPSRSGISQRLMAWMLANACGAYEKAMSGQKQELFAGIQGRVLEIGPGTGANLRYYSPGTEWVGIEPNIHMHPYLRKEAERLGLDVEIRTGQAEGLPVEDHSVDAVVSTLVLCSVEDPDVALREVLRVLKPGGRFIFIEHVAAPQGTRLRRVQGWVRPMWKVAGDGCHPDRETWVTLETAGFEAVEYQRFEAPVPIPIVRPHIKGVATKTA